MPRRDEHEDARRPDDTNRTTRGQPDDPPAERSGRERPPDERQTASGRSERRAGARLREVFASAALRWGIGIAGAVLFLFAIGRAVGVDLLGLLAEALTTQTGRWLAVAVIGLFLVAVARRGIVRTNRT